LLINSAGSKTLRFVPPLIITTQDVYQAIKVLDEVMEVNEKRFVKYYELERQILT